MNSPVFPAFSASPTSALAVFDARVADLEALHSGLRTDIETIVLLPDTDGIAQLSEIFRTRRNLQQLHLIAPGRSGTLQLGSSAVDAVRLRNLDWRAAFGARAEVLVYDEVAEVDAERAELLFALERATGTTALAFPKPSLASVPRFQPASAAAPADIPLDRGDYAALQALYRATSGQYWIRRNGWDTDNTNDATAATPPLATAVAQWHGVTVAGDRVVAIALPFNNLRGELPHELSNLTHLTELDLGDNWLRGEIPAELGQLSRLINLYLSSNMLAGKIPAELGALGRLMWLSIGSNHLSGEIPPELARLGNLRGLYLNGNNLAGQMPAALGTLPHLQDLYLNDNELSGSIPKALSELRYLTHLALGHNQLSGDIPIALGQLSSLQALYLNDNHLDGLVPRQLERLPHFEKISLHGNPDLRLQVPSAIASRLCPMFQPPAIEASSSRSANVSKNLGFANTKAGNFSSV